MPDPKEQAPIIIKKKKGHEGHHGGAWKVAYADFVTAMMAFFLVMWLVAQAPEVKESVSQYFNDPGGFKKGNKSSVLKGAGPAIIDRKSMSESDRKQAEEIMKKELMKAADRIRSELSGLPEFANLKDKVDIEMTTEGLRIQLIESSGSSDSTFFRIGGKNLNNRGKAILSSISAEFKKLKNKIVIEGHTDSRTFVYDDKYSNWELSTDRANSARRLMEEVGVKGDQIEAVRGYSNKRLMIPENPFDPRNRRIAIIVLNDYAADRYAKLQTREWAIKIND